MTATARTAHLRTRLDSWSDRSAGLVIGAMRIVAGLLWLSNLEWKRPPNFGQDLKNGLYKYVDGGIKHPVFGPYSWFLEHVVVKQYHLFGWITLIAESTVAVLLLLGLWTRLVALIGAALSVSIMLSVLHYPNEWPWSYFLMIALHLVLFATAAGTHLGLDGALSRRHTAGATQVLGAIAVVAGIAGFVVARDIGFAAHRGVLVGNASWELKLLWFNRLSALLTVVLGAVAVFGSGARQAALRWVAAGGFAVLALQVLLQWRTRKGVTDSGVLGGTGSTMAFFAMLAVGLAVCARRGERPR